MSVTNQELGQQIQAKFHFYMVSLVFTILALAVETAKFAGPPLAGIFELFAWLCLFVSGVLGLLRFESVPRLYTIFDAQQRLKKNRAKLQELVEAGVQAVYDENKGKDIPLKTHTQSVDADIGMVENLGDELNEKINRFYLVHRWLFVIGVACLIVSRGLVQILTLVSWFR